MTREISPKKKDFDALVLTKRVCLENDLQWLMTFVICLSFCFLVSILTKLLRKNLMRANASTEELNFLQFLEIVLEDFKNFC